MELDISLEEQMEVQLLGSWCPACLDQPDGVELGIHLLSFHRMTGDDLKDFLSGERRMRLDLIRAEVDESKQLHFIGALAELLNVYARILREEAKPWLTSQQGS